MLSWLRFFGLFILIPVAVFALGHGVARWEQGRIIDVIILLGMGIWFLVRPGLLMGLAFVVAVISTLQ